MAINKRKTRTRKPSAKAQEAKKQTANKHTMPKKNQKITPNKAPFADDNVTAPENEAMDIDSVSQNDIENGSEVHGVDKIKGTTGAKSDGAKTDEEATEEEEDVVNLSTTDFNLDDTDLQNALKAFSAPLTVTEASKTKSSSTSLPVAMESQQTLAIKNITSKQTTGVIHAAAESVSKSIGFTDRRGRNGAMFTVVFVDANGHRLKVIFSGQAKDAFENRIHRGVNYSLTIGEVHVRDANTRYNHTGCKFEVTATADMSILELPAKTIKLATDSLRLNFIQSLHSSIDQVGNVTVVVCDVGELKATTGSNNGPASVMRHLHVFDGSTPHQALIKLYGTDAKLPIKPGTVLNFDLMRVYRNYSTNTFESLANSHVNQTDATHRIRINPSVKEVPEAMRLKMLYAACKQQSPKK